MPGADKRQRKKENARAAREAREAAEKRQKRFRSIRNIAIVGVILIGGIVLIQVITGGDSKKSDSTTTPTVSDEETSTTVALPAGCSDTIPATTTKDQKQKAPPLTIDPNKTYTAKITTSCGEIDLALNAKTAPKSVNNFVFLAKQGFYDGLQIFRVAQTPSLVQTGDPQNSGEGTAGYMTVVEYTKGDSYPANTVLWAKGNGTQSGTAGSQFMITTGKVAVKQGVGGDRYGEIGTVSGGDAALQKMMTLANPDSVPGVPRHPIYVEKISITES